MVRFKQTEEILRIIGDRARVRNIGIIAHIDHGKTTLTDSLLASSGLLSEKIAGEARALDYLEEEQKRGITIKTANISLLHEFDGKEYVINLIDTPGHVDFTGKVTRALRAIDGTVVVVDAVEEVMVQTETVTRQALSERVRPLLYINKIDRLITELKLRPEQIQEKLMRIISKFNNLIEIFGEKGYREKWKVSPIKNNVAFGSAKDRWGFTLRMAKEANLTFNDVIEYYKSGSLEELRRKAPLHRAILDMVVEHVPTPIEAQKYRIEKIWKGDLNSEIGKAMINCDECGPVAFMVTNVTVDPKAGIVATGRLLSGTLEPGQEVYLLNSQTKDRILQVGMYMGPWREIVPKMIAGNIPAVLGLEHARAGETVTTVPDMIPFEAIKYISEPVVTIAIEPKHSRDLPKLVSELRKMAIEDPNLVVKINEETGEYLISGMGVLHLELAVHFLRKKGLEILTSQPIVVYRETITRRSAVFPGKSPNKHNKFKLYLEPLEEEVVRMITSGELTDGMPRKLIANKLFDLGWPMAMARNVWRIDERGNLLINMTKGVQFLDEARSMIEAAFKDFCEEGVLAREPVRGVKVILVDAELHEDPAHRTFAQIYPAIHRALLGAMLTADPAIYEPIMSIQIQVPGELIGAVTSVLSSKRGLVLGIDQREYFTVINGEIPTAETFDLSTVMRGSTSGRAFWQMRFSRWRLLPKSLAPKVITEIRKRKGLPESIPSWRDFVPPGEEVQWQ
ncbi:elongation factor EF-2 [Candidatus Geothermarchaeota archaeon]|nr:MAG: elongation factor EF-2 [Candidatus Geothermarchaeota archaeon]